jgi:hypothetical protein
MTGLKALEGRRVALRLADGSRLEDWELVSVGGAGPDTAWVWNTMGRHAFVPISDVVDLWEMPS